MSRQSRHTFKENRRSRSLGPQVVALLLAGVGLLVLGAAALILLPRPAASAGEPDPESFARAVPVPVDFAAPALQLTGLDGQPVALSDYRGQVVLVNNWATWCPPCKAEMPTLQAYYEAHRQQGFVVIAIEAGEPVDQVQAFARDYGLTFPVWPDPGVQALRLFRNETLPNSYVIDRQGQVRLAWSGAISIQSLEQYVTPLLED